MFKTIGSIIVFILSISFVFFYVVPAYELNKERRGNIESLTKFLDTSGEIKALIDQTKKSLNSVDPMGLSRFEVFIPEKIDPIRFVNNIQSIGFKNRIVLTDIKIEETKANGDAKKGPTGAIQGLVNTVSIGSKIDQAQGSLLSGTSKTTTASDKKFVTTKANIAFTSTYETFQLFLNDLERSLGLVNVTSVSFAPIADASDAKKTRSSAPTYQFTVGIETYSLK